jgi:hypothetical protein
MTKILNCDVCGKGEPTLCEMHTVVNGVQVKEWLCTDCQLKLVQECLSGEEDNAYV